MSARTPHNSPTRTPEQHEISQQIDASHAAANGFLDTSSVPFNVTFFEDAPTFNHHSPPRPVGTNTSQYGFAPNPANLALQQYADATRPQDTSVFGQQQQAQLDVSRVNLSAKRTVLPLPTTLDDSYIQQQQRPNSATGFGHNTSFHEKTFSAHQKSLLGASGRLNRSVQQNRRSASAMTTSLATSSGNSSRVTVTQCCGEKKLRSATEPKSDVKGLYVTYCEQSMEAQMLNAKRELEYEQDRRRQEEHKQQNALIKVLRQLRAAETERDQYKKDYEDLKKVRAEEERNQDIIRSEFEHRWRSCEQQLAETREQLFKAQQAQQESKILENTKEAQVMHLDMGLRQATDALHRVEKDAIDNANRAQLYFDERIIFQRRVQELEREVKRLTENLTIKDIALKGTERDLKNANEKLSSVAVLRDSLKKRGGTSSDADLNAAATLAAVAKHGAATTHKSKAASKLRGALGKA